MGKNQTYVTSDTAREYRLKYPNTKEWNDSKLAKLMFAECNGLFETVEQARSCLRGVQGKKGDLMRKKIKDKSLFIKEERPTTFPMPDSWSKVKPIFTLPVACNKIGFMSDFQSPFHDVTAIKVFVRWLKRKGINTLFLNGDVVDFYGISEYIKDPRQRDFNAERDTTVGILKWLRNEFPDIVIYYNLDANHERRWEKWKYKHPEIMMMPEFELDIILKLNEMNIIPLRNHKYIKIGKLHVLHGDTVFGRWGSGVAKARTVFLKTIVSCIVSHVHIPNEFTKKDLEGKMITCWTTGCFMNIDDVEYNPHNEYTHGGAYIETDEDGNFWVENKRIENGVIW